MTAPVPVPDGTTPPAEAVEPRNAPSDAWGGGVDPTRCDDLAWWSETGMCGGCGGNDCHEGPCGDQPINAAWFGWARRICDRCQYRKDQGLVR